LNACHHLLTLPNLKSTGQPWDSSTIKIKDAAEEKELNE